MQRLSSVINLMMATFGSGHTPRPLDGLPGSVRVLGHRGGAGLAPENTMAAFDASGARGEGFELDVTLSADGEIVVIHDDDVDRTTNGSGAVAELSWAELAALDAGSSFDASYAGVGLPTLDQVLSSWAGKVPIDIELKTTRHKEALATAVVRCIERYDAVSSVFVTSFDPFLLGEVAALNPAILRGQLTATFKESDLNAAEKLVLRRLWLNRISKPDLLVFEDVRLTPEVVRRWKRRGYSLLAWTVNDPARMAALIDMGVDGVITDHPDRWPRSRPPA